MRISDWSSDVCSSDLAGAALQIAATAWLWLLLPSDGIVLWRWVPPLALLGLGAGLIIASLITIIIGAAADHEVGSGSGLLAAVQPIRSEQRRVRKECARPSRPRWSPSP